jgi:hypothetical protein
MNPTTGKYRGREVIDVVTKTAKKADKKKARNSQPTS